MRRLSHAARARTARAKPLSGGNLFESPAFKVYTSNLTPDKETGLGNWTADQIKNAIMKGVRPDGTVLAVMPSNYYTVLTQRDADAIVAYLRSLKPVKNAVPAPEYKVAVKPDRRRRRRWARSTARRAAAIISRPSAIAWNAIRRARRASRWSRPRWASASTNSKGRGASRPRATSPPTRRRVSAPGPMPRSSGRSRTGVSKNGDKLKPPMGFAAYAKMTDKDMSDLIAYLRTVPAKQ